MTRRRSLDSAAAPGVAGVLAALVALAAVGRAQRPLLRADHDRDLGRGWSMWRDLGFLSDAAESLERLAAGFLIGSAIGSASGYSSGLALARRRSSHSSISCARRRRSPSRPPADRRPGFGDGMRIPVIAFGVCFPVLLNTVDGVRAMSPRRGTRPRCSTSGGWIGPVRIYFPAALPSIVTGLRVAISIALVLVVVAEFVGEGGGLGGYLEVAAARSEFPEVYACILFLGLVGYVLNRLFALVERRLLAWHYGAIGEQPSLICRRSCALSASGSATRPTARLRSQDVTFDVRERRAPRRRRTVRVRKDDAPPHALRPHEANGGSSAPRRAADRRSTARSVARLPGLQSLALPVADRAPQRHVSPAPLRALEGREDRAGRGGPTRDGAQRRRREVPVAALRRDAAARRHRPRARLPSGDRSSSTSRSPPSMR